MTLGQDVSSLFADMIKVNHCPTLFVCTSAMCVCMSVTQVFLVCMSVTNVCMSAVCLLHEYFLSVCLSVTNVCLYVGWRYGRHGAEEAGIPLSG